MYSILLLAIVSFAAALILTPWIRNIFRNRGLVDSPDGERKVHGADIPRVGGIAVASAYILAFLVLLASPLSGARTVVAGMGVVTQLMPAGVMIFAVGLWDDLFGMKPLHKLTGQIAAAGLAYLGGVQIHSIQGHALEEWWWSLPLTLFWLVLCTNAFNLIDGVDGLASGVGLFATLTTLCAGLMRDNFALALATVPLAGALLGFLRYNFNPASIFLGDSGSYVVGFLLGCFGVMWSQKAATLLGMTAPLMALAIPLLDVALAVVRRFLRGQPIFGADRGHIHHRLLDRGLTPRRAVLLLYGMSGIFAGLSLLGSAQERYTGLILLMFAVVAYVGIQNLGYVELTSATRMLRLGQFRKNLSSEIALRSGRAQLEQAQTVEECWESLSGLAQSLGFSRVRLTMAGRVFEDSYNGAAEVWRVTAPLPNGDEIVLGHSSTKDSQAMPVAPLVEMIRETLTRKEGLREEARRRWLRAG
jgi:UDP-GlcNAc:undecaprenyl-phosphate GlcNAc-1-phosphate transferase